MTKDKLTNLYSDAGRYISAREFRAAFDALRQLGDAAGAAAVLPELDVLEQRYFYMLRFISGGNTVPGTDKELEAIGKTAAELCNRLYIEGMVRDDNSLYYSQLRYQRLRPEENPGSLVSDYLSEHERLRTDSASLTDSRRQAARERLATDIFNRIWVEYPLSDESATLLESIILDDDIPEHDRILWTGALGLGSLHFSDSRRTDLLLAIHSGAGETLSAIAAVWLVLGNEASGVEDCAGPQRVAEAIDRTNGNDLTDIYLELYRATGTEAMTADMRRNIMPGLMDIGRKLAGQADCSPDKIAEQLGTGGFDAIKGFMEAQANGDDVYMDTLGHMRQFPFFHGVANWFLPFYASHSELSEVTDGEGAAIAEAVDRMPMFCDSDKYALILSIAMAPKSMQTQMFNAMMENSAMMPGSEEFDTAMSEMKRHGRRAVINNYIRNLYRFFRLYRRKNEFAKVFDTGGEFHNFPAATLADNHHEGLRAIGELLMKQKNYTAAFGVYTLLLNYDDTNADYWFSRGLCNKESLNPALSSVDFERALELRPGHLPTVRLLSEAYMANEEYEEAIGILEPATAANPDDIELLRTLADACYGASNNARALEVCYNIAYLAPDDASIKPMMAWLLALGGDFDAAELLYADFIGDSNEALDLMRYGHTLWAAGRTADALEAYAQAERAADAGQTGEFRKLFAISLGDGIGQAIGADRYSALHTVPDILAFRNYGSRLGHL